MSRILSHQYIIFDAFNECFYVVPDYQREYVWTEKEVLQLLDDINEEFQSPNKQEYFIGTILVSPTEEMGHYEVIDGQQRITTFFLLLCAMRSLFKGEQQEAAINQLITTNYINSAGEVIKSLKLDPRYENASELFKLIVELNSDPDSIKNAIQAYGIAPFGSMENLIGAYDAIYRYLNENYPQKSDLQKYWGFIMKKVEFIQISTDVSSALKIFETINERGIGLNPMDLLKNLLFTQVKTDEFAKLKDRWKIITNKLDQNKEKPLRFLRYFLMANYKIKNNRNDNIVREDEIYDWFIEKDNVILCDYKNKPFDFVEKLIRNVNKFIEFSKGKGNDGLDNINMDNLRRLCGGAFSLHFVLLLAASGLPKSLFNHFVSELESFLFYYIFTKSATRELERNFSIWADELRDIVNEADKTEQIRKYNLFLQSRFANNMKSKDIELTSFMQRYTLKSMQQYRTRYLLSKYTQYVDMAYKGMKTPGSLQEYANLEIEHILPNTPSTSLRADFIAKNPGKDYDEYKIRLGNLTLLEKPINIVASNDYFIKKCDEYKKSKYYLTSSIAQITDVGVYTSITRINKYLKSFSTWDSSAIEERQEIYINLTKDIWKIEDYV